MSQTDTAVRSVPAADRPRVMTVMLAGSISIVVLFGAVLGVLAVYSPPVRSPLAEERSAINSYVVSPFATPRDLRFLEPDERAHLEDVGRVFDVAWLVTLLSVGVILVSTMLPPRDRAVRARRITRARRAPAFGLLGGLIVVSLTAFIDFGVFWTAFHRLMFPQGGWQFPARSRLLRIYPESYFEGFVMRWTIVVFAVALVIGFARWPFARRRMRS